MNKTRLIYFLFLLVLLPSCTGPDAREIASIALLGFPSLFLLSACAIFFSVFIHKKLNSQLNLDYCFKTYSALFILTFLVNSALVLSFSKSNIDYKFFYDSLISNVLYFGLFVVIISYLFFKVFLLLRIAKYHPVIPIFVYLAHFTLFINGLFFNVFIKQTEFVFQLVGLTVSYPQYIFLAITVLIFVEFSTFFLKLKLVKEIKRKPRGR